jgi:hypothetical protein
MKLQKAVYAVLWLGLLAVSALAADISGQWKAEFTLPDGSARQNTLNFKQDGEKLTGTVASQMGDAEIRDGKVSGDTVSFYVMRNFGGNDAKLSYSGQVSGSEIKFKVSVEGADREFEMTAKKVS